jgi:hypothetical protein
MDIGNHLRHCICVVQRVRGVIDLSHVCQTHQVKKLVGNHVALHSGILAEEGRASADARIRIGSLRRCKGYAWRIKILGVTPAPASPVLDAASLGEVLLDETNRLIQSRPELFRGRIGTGSEFVGDHRGVASEVSNQGLEGNDFVIATGIFEPVEFCLETLQPAQYPCQLRG